MDRKSEFIAVIQENEGLIYKVTRVYTNGGEERKDLYQDIVYQVWKCYDSFRNEAKVSTWLYRIALNTAIAYVNKEKRKGYQVPIDEMVLNRPDTTDPVLEERSELLFTQIRKLNDIEKGIILLYLDGNSYEEIAVIMGFTVTNIGTRLGRIKEKLKEQIK